MALKRGRGDLLTPARSIPGQPLVSYPTPNIVDVVVREDVQVSPHQYQPLVYGTPHPSNDVTGLDLRLVWQSPPTGDDARMTVQRIYASVRTAQDVYNYAQKFTDESNAHPVFIRTYIEKRATYAPLAKNSKFTGIMAVIVTAGGADYDPEKPPDVVVSGGGGSGAALRAVIYNGQVAHIQILSEGTGYTSAPTISFTNPQGGSGATATAAIQPAGALLVSEEMQRLDNEDPKLASLFVRVHRVYKVLPGPILHTKRIGQPNLTPEKYRRLVRTDESDQLQGPDYAFPSGLIGDQTSIEHQQQTITEARLKIIEEIVAIGADALLGGETDKFGPLAIYEAVVNEGTAIDAGFLVLKSTVTPFGNGKAVRITVKYPADLALKQIVEKSLGQDNLIPEKYRRLVRHNVTESMVDPTLYIFPIKLYGDESQVSYIEDTINRARLKVIEEVIDNINSLVGQETEEFGVDLITETIVPDGTPVDSNFLIKKCTVTPLGNGKSIKITATYLNAVVVAVKVINGGSGYSNGVFFDGTFVGGGGSGATFNYNVNLGHVLDQITVTNGGSNYTSLPTPVVPTGTGAIFQVYLGGPLLTSRLYDEEMKIHYTETKQIVMAGTPDSPEVNNVNEETKGLDVYRSLRTRTTKIPTAVDVTTAIRSRTFQPYKFPGTLDAFLAAVSDGFLGYRSAKADLVKHEIKTWWVVASSIPTIPFDEIISDTITIQGISRAERFSDVLHDAITTHINNTGASQFYPATSPSFSVYYNGTPSGTSVPHNYILAVEPGSGGYSVGDILTFFGAGDNAQIRITGIQSLGFIYSWEILDEGLSGVYTNPVTAVGGTGSGAKFDIIPYSTPNYIPGTAWVGTERVIAASVTEEPQKNLWKVQTHTVVMR